MLKVFTLNVVMLSVVLLSAIMLSAIMLSVVMLSVVVLSVIMLSVVAPQKCKCRVKKETIGSFLRIQGLYSQHLIFFRTYKLDQ